jgi:hypothetical protein
VYFLYRTIVLYFIPTITCNFPSCHLFYSLKFIHRLARHTAYRRACEVS